MFRVKTSIGSLLCTNTLSHWCLVETDQHMVQHQIILGSAVYRHGHCCLKSSCHLPKVSSPMAAIYCSWSMAAQVDGSHDVSSSKTANRAICWHCWQAGPDGWHLNLRRLFKAGMP